MVAVLITYKCRDCGKVFKVWGGGVAWDLKPKPQRCPQCGSMNTKRPGLVSWLFDLVKGRF